MDAVRTDSGSTHGASGFTRYRYSMSWERDWGWIISWMNKRAAQGSTAARDMYAGGGPFLIDRKTICRDLGVRAM